MILWSLEKKRLWCRCRAPCYRSLENSKTCKILDFSNYPSFGAPWFRMRVIPLWDELIDNEDDCLWIVSKLENKRAGSTTWFHFYHANSIITGPIWNLDTGGGLHYFLWQRMPSCKVHQHNFYKECPYVSIHVGVSQMCINFNQI